MANRSDAFAFVFDVISRTEKICSVFGSVCKNTNMHKQKKNWFKGCSVFAGKLTILLSMSANVVSIQNCAGEGETRAHVPPAPVRSVK